MKQYLMTKQHKDAIKTALKKYWEAKHSQKTDRHIEVAVKTMTQSPETLLRVIHELELIKANEQNQMNINLLNDIISALSKWDNKR